MGAKLNVWAVSTAYPLVFRIAASDADPAEKVQLYALIDSYLVRRALCGLTPKALNKTVARLAGAMIKDGVSVGAFALAFAGQRGDRVRFPADAEFRAAIRNKPVYDLIRRKERIADVLWDLECASRGKYSVQTPRPAELLVEHILPQAWMAHWSLGDGRTAPADKLTGADEAMLAGIHVREAALQTLGNLTLITVPGNGTASNRAFGDKKLWLRKSLLALNLSIIEHATWDEAAITQRADAPADLAIAVWPGPGLP